MLIKYEMYIYFGLNFVHLFFIYFIRYLIEYEEASDLKANNSKFVACVMMAVLERSRSLMASLLRMNVFFEWIALYVLIKSERNKSMGKLLY